MKNINPMPRSYFDKFSDKPVLVKPYDPKSKQLAKEYISSLEDMLSDFDVEIIHRGSTAFGISGKGDIEIGVFPSEEDWKSVVSKLVNEFGESGNVENDYVRFNDERDDYEIEIILLKGEAAKIDIALTKFLLEHSESLKKYEEIKKKYSYSKREYQIQKDVFLRGVIDSIPE